MKIPLLLYRVGKRSGTLVTTALYTKVALSPSLQLKITQKITSQNLSRTVGLKKLKLILMWGSASFAKGSCLSLGMGLHDPY